MRIADPIIVESVALHFEATGFPDKALGIRQRGYFSVTSGGRPPVDMTQDQKLAIGYAHFIGKWHAYVDWEEAVKFACTKIDMFTAGGENAGLIEIRDGFSNLVEMIAGRRPRARVLLEDRVWVRPKFALHKKDKSSFKKCS